MRDFLAILRNLTTVFVSILLFIIIFIRKIYFYFYNSGLEITAGQRTMSGQK